jgi:exodeoxyribonuclease V alpha subunit
MNGDVGVTMKDGDRLVVAFALADGTIKRYPAIRVADCETVWAMTIHKSQGSQFNRVIVPIRESRLLDQTLIYTAITRAVDQVVLVGNRRALEEAISAPASAAGRHVTLPELMSGRAQFGI